MNYEELDAAEAERRKAQQVQYRNRKRTSMIFTFFVSIFEIIISLVIFFALFLSFLAICTRLPNAEAFMGKAFFPGTIIILILSMYIGFKIYKVFCRFLINKLNLKEKMLESVLIHYETKAERKARG